MSCGTSAHWILSAGIRRPAAKNGRDVCAERGGQSPFIYKSTDNMMIQTLAKAPAIFSQREAEIFNDTDKGDPLYVLEHVNPGPFLPLDFQLSRQFRTRAGRRVAADSMVWNACSLSQISRYVARAASPQFYLSIRR